MSKVTSADEARFASMAATIGAENDKVDVPMIGRLAGVGGAALATGLSMMNNGITPSNVLGGVAGACTGYVIGSQMDAGLLVYKTLGQMSGKESKTANTVAGVGLGAIAFTTAYGIAKGVDNIASGLNKFVTPKEVVIQDHEEITYDETNIASLM